MYAKADVLDNLQAVLDTAHNERYTPYEELKDTPGHEKNTERDHNRWAGGMYTYDVNFTTENRDGTRQRWNATAVVRVNAKGKRFVYDIVNFHDGSPISTSIRNGYLARKGQSLPAAPGNIRYIKSKDGHVVGWYDRAKKEIVALPGATAETMAHELGWHATYDYAVELAKGGDDKLLEKLNEYAEGAKNIIIDPVTGRTLADEITERYKMNGVDDPAVLLDEIGAARFTMEHVGKIKDVAARRMAAKWYECT